MGTFAQHFNFIDWPGYPRPSVKSPQALDATSTTQNYPLWTRCVGEDPILGTAEFVYLEGAADTVAGDVIQLNPDGTTTRDVAGTVVGHVGVAMSANVANQYGWYCVKGRCLVAIGEDIAANLQMYLDAAAAGKAADTVTGTGLIHRASNALGLDAGGSAVLGTSTDTTAAHQTVAAIQYPYAIKAV